MSLQEVSDRLEIQDTVHRLVLGFDRRDWHTVEHLNQAPAWQLNLSSTHPRNRAAGHKRERT